MFSAILFVGRVAATMIALAGSALAQDGWTVQKSSGEVWVVSEGAQQVALTPATTIKPGDRIRTGRSGRALLVRNAETILVSPNTVIGIPTETGDGMTTTILQESGSILLEVEKKNQKHFEVETPYLVAVVKGTQFQVSVDHRGSRVDVMSGQVEVADLKTGQNALVLPGQIASVLGQGTGGLSLKGLGSLDAVKDGLPRPSRVLPTPNITPPSINRASQPGSIKAALGDVKLDFNKVTKGLARSEGAARATMARNRDNGAEAKSSPEKNAGKGAVNAITAAVGAGGDKGGGNGGGSGSTLNNVGSSLGLGGGNGNGNANGLGNGNGNGNGNGLGLGLGNGNGNGNGLGLGNGNGNGHGLGGGVNNVVGDVVGLGNGIGNGLGNAFGKGKK